MSQPNHDDQNTSYLKDKISRLDAEEIVLLNQRALTTLLFIYSEGGLQYDDKDIEKYPGLAERNRFMYGTVGDYFILDLLRASGWIEGDSNRQSRWAKIFLTDKGLEKAQQLHKIFMANSYETVISL